jgi:hypothetical protein
MKALGRARQAKGRAFYDADVNMPAFLTAKNLKPFISQELEVTSSQREFRTLRGTRAAAQRCIAWIPTLRRIEPKSFPQWERQRSPTT